MEIYSNPVAITQHKNTSFFHPCCKSSTREAGHLEFAFLMLQYFQYGSSLTISFHLISFVISSFDIYFGDLDAISFGNSS